MTAAAAVEPTELEELMEAQAEAAHGGLFDGPFWLIPSSIGTFRVKMRSCRPQRGST